MNDQKKKILLGIPNHFSFHKVFTDQLTKSGFEVIDLSGTERKFRYKNLGQRLHNLYRKLILKDYGFKNKLRQKEIEAFYEQRLNSISQVDYALFIRADLFPIPTLEHAKKISKVLVGYQWDGLKRFPEISPRIDLFDRFFVFDPTDVAPPKRLPISNFYIESDIEADRQIDTDILFIGTFIDERMQDIYNFFNMLKGGDTLKVKALINVINSENRNKMISACAILSPFSTGMSYYENLALVKKSIALADFSNYLHDGLSFRVFEAIGHEKKLITNQKSIKLYDFYHPQNILVLDEKTDYNVIVDFLKMPYKKLLPEIKRKYSFGNWINYLLDKDEYIEIDLPKINNPSKD